VVVLRAGFRDQLDSRANTVAIAFGSLQLDLQPVIVSRALIEPNLCGSVDRAHHNIQAAIAVEVAT